MIPNNNLSVLPWYTSIEQQNARKWWVYGRVYPLFTPAGSLLPFQCNREPSRTEIFNPSGSALSPITIHEEYFLGIDETSPGVYEYTLETSVEWDNVAEYSVSGLNQIYFDNLPNGLPYSDNECNVVFVDIDDNVLRWYNFNDGDSSYNGGVRVPTGADRVFVQVRNHATPSVVCSVYDATITYIISPVQSFKIYKADGTLYADVSNDIIPLLSIKPLPQTDCIIYPGTAFIISMPNGQYYAVMSDGTNTLYSEIFTVVNDIQPYLKIEWWDLEDFVMDAGTIVYKNPAFKNVLYLDATIAKPEYPFEEEGETRDGYFFPVKMISEKRYRFKFLASEYLLDVMRFIRMADFAQITANGQTYSLDTFLITPEWEAEGDVASVEAQFDTATVAKKIGVGYIKAQN